MSKEKRIIVQGDILFCKVKDIPAEAKKQMDGIIARGEITGHTHALRPDRPGINVMMVLAGVAYVRAVYEAFVDHQEHDTVILPPGNWEISRQREYQPEGWKQVAD